MISQMMAEVLNKQLNKEFYSAYLYLGMSSWCADQGYAGSANWFMKQYEEERDHALKVYRYIQDQGATVELLAIAQPEIAFGSLLACFEESLEHEVSMTASFNELCDLALREKDHASYQFFMWFVQEQVEEEASVGEVIAKLKLVSDGNGIFMIDEQLGSRDSAQEAGA